MKLIKLIFGFFHKVRLSAFFLFLIMTASMFFASYTYGRYLKCAYAKKLFERSEAQKGCYVMSTGNFNSDSAYETAMGNIDKQAEGLKGNPAVKSVLFIKSVNPESYHGTGISILLYSDALLEAFPELKKYGVDFGNDPDDMACILGSRIFEGVKTGDSIDLINITGSEERNFTH
jgi:hypothetical protein